MTVETIDQRPALAAVAEPANAPARPLRVVIADDHARMRRGMRQLLEAEGEIAVAAETSDLQSTAGVVAEHRPDVLVLDMCMPDGSTLKHIGELRKRSPGTQIVIASMEDAPGFAQRALTAGALGYVLKEFADADLPSAVRAAARGDEYLSPQIAGRISVVRQALTEGRLTARETEVLRLIALGHTNVEIARSLEVSARTIETHRANIHEKLGLRTRAELVRYALRCGLLET